TVGPVEFPAQPGAALTVYTRLVVLVLKVVLFGAVRTRPLPTAPLVTTMVLFPVSAVKGVTVMVAGLPTPAVVLQVIGPDTTAFRRLFEVTVSVTFTDPLVTVPTADVPTPLN